MNDSKPFCRRLLIAAWLLFAANAHAAPVERVAQPKLHVVLVVDGLPNEQLMRRAWNSQRSGGLMVVTRPYWFFGSGSTGTSHGSPYAYDTNVPPYSDGPALDPARP